MLTNKRVTNVITGKYSFEAGILDMFKNVFNSTADGKVWDSKIRSHEIKKLLEKTFLKPKWVADNCKEMVELDSHEFPFLSMYDPKGEFLTSEELIKGVDEFNKKMEESYLPLRKAMEWASDVFKEAQKEVIKAGPNDRRFKEGLMDEDEVGEEREAIEKAIKEVMEKHSSEQKSHAKSLEKLDAKFSPYLENKNAAFKLVGKSKNIKITTEEFVDFLKLVKDKDILDDDLPSIMTVSPPENTSPEPVYILPIGYLDLSEFLFHNKVYHNVYQFGDPSKFFSDETLIDILKQFIDK